MKKAEFAKTKKPGAWVSICKDGTMWPAILPCSSLYFVCLNLINMLTVGEKSPNTVVAFIFPFNKSQRSNNDYHARS